MTEYHGDFRNKLDLAWLGLASDGNLARPQGWTVDPVVCPTNVNRDNVGDVTSGVVQLFTRVGAGGLKKARQYLGSRDEKAAVA